MTWNDFSKDEKRAVVRSAAYVANANGNISYSQEMYFNVLLMQMGADNQFVKDAMSMWKINMIRVLRNMDNEKKNIILNVWISIMCRSMGGVYTSMNLKLNEFPEEGNVIREMVRDCSIDISKYG